MMTVSHIRNSHRCWLPDCTKTICDVWPLKLCGGVVSSRTAPMAASLMHEDIPSPLSARSVHMIDELA
jgi:hypothetical protein